MNKKQVQQRVLQNGKPLALSKFSWDEKTSTFSSDECCLVLDFSDIDYCTFKTGSDCTFDTGSYCTFDTSSDCTFKTGSYCTFKTGSYCTFDTGSYCTFDTRSDCTFDTGSDCTFDTNSYCTFKTSFNCVIVRRGSIFEVIQPKKGDIIQICPYSIEGYLVNGLYKGEPHIIADGILSKIISKKGNIYKVINHGETKQTYLIEKNGLYAHGETIKQAKEDIIYKISNRDTSKYDSMTLKTILTKEEAIEMYMVITGACSEGTKYFVNSRDDIKSKMTIQEVINITAGQYNQSALINFFKGK